MRLNYSGLGQRLFVAASTTLALATAANLTADFMPSALAQSTIDDASADDNGSKIGRRRYMKRARRAQENAAAQATDGDSANSSLSPNLSANTNLTAGSSAPANGRFDGPGARRYGGGGGGGGLKRRLAGEVTGINGGIGRGPLDLSQLNLTDEQKTRITDQRSKSKGQAKELQGAIKAKRVEMRSMMFDPAFSPEQIRAKRQELRKVQDQAELLMLNDFLSMRAVLTPDQLRKLRPNMAARSRVAEAAATPPAEAAPDSTSSVTSNFATVNAGSTKGKNK